MSALNEKYDLTKTKLKQLVTEQKYVCCTVDAWSSHAQSYLGMTIHFIDDKFERKSYLLAFKRLIGKQTYDVLGNQIHGILTEFNLSKTNFTNIVTDGGSAFCKMFQKYGDAVEASEINILDEEVEESATNNNPPEYEDVSSAVEAQSQNTISTSLTQDCMIDENGCEFQSEIIDLNVSSDEQVSNVNNCEDIDNYFGEHIPTVTSEPQLSIVLPPQKRCLPHILNLSTNDFKNGLTGLAKTAFYHHHGIITHIVGDHTHKFKSQIHM